MYDAKTILLVCLALVAVAFVVFWVRAIVATTRTPDASSPDGRIAPTPYQMFVGAVTDFFDTLGVGSFATTTALYRWGRSVSDELIPGTLNVGHTIPTVAQAFIYTQIVEVDPWTLIWMILAAVAGAWLGAGVVSSWSKQRVQVGMGIALLAAAVVILLRVLKLLPAGGDALALSGAWLVVGLAGNFVLGMLMTLGIGLYAPCMILVSLLGMNPTAAFPIMMGSCAFLMPVANVQFVNNRRYSLRAALGLTLLGTPAVFAAAFLVKSLELDTVRWLVVVVVLYTAITMLLAGRRTATSVSSVAGGTS